MRSIKKSGHSTAVISASSVIIFAVVAIVAAYYFNVWPFNEQRPAESSSTATPALNEDSEEPTTSEKPVDSTSNSVKNNPTKSNASSNGSSISITSVQKNVDMISVRTAIQEVTSSGECTLNVRNSSNNKTYSDTVGVQALASNSTCKGFNVPISELASGTWEITVTYMLNGAEKAKDSVQEVVNA